MEKCEGTVVFTNTAVKFHSMKGNTMRVFCGIPLFQCQKETNEGG